MPTKNTAITVQYVAWDTVNNTGKTGDVANHAIRGVGDGTEFTPAASPAEVNSSDFKGVYKIAIAAGENNYDFVTLGGQSSTAGIVLIPITWTNSSPPGIRKNVPLNGFEFPMIDSANRPSRKSGATVTPTRSIDAGAFGACTNAAAEVGTTGVYKINLSASDLNGATIGLLFAATGCDDTYVELITQP